MGNGTRRGVMRRFYFIRPKPNANAEELAMGLIRLKLVEQVFLTEGDCGFIVRARFNKEKEPKDITDYISRNISNRYGRVVSRCEYRK